MEPRLFCCFEYDLNSFRFIWASPLLLKSAQVGRYDSQLAIRSVLPLSDFHKVDLLLIADALSGNIH